MQAYVTITADSVEVLDERINKAIEKGYYPSGSMIVNTHNNFTKYYQPMYYLEVSNDCTN